MNTEIDEEEFDRKLTESIKTRNPQLMPREPIHPWRWRMLTLWIIIFSVVVGIETQDNRSSIRELKETKANIQSLQATNCGLKKFLLTAKRARTDAASTEKNKVVRKADLEAAKGYAQLLKPFTPEATGNCKIHVGLNPGGD